jgi:hypothetical protein
MDFNKNYEKACFLECINRLPRSGAYWGVDTWIDTVNPLQSIQFDEK